MEEKFKFTQENELILPQKQKSYPIPTSEWSRIKFKINSISSKLNYWQTAGSVLIGTAIPTLVTALCGNFITEKESWIYWGAFLITTMMGILCFVFGELRRNDQNKTKEDIVDYMNSIEERFFTNNSLEINSARYGFEETYVDVLTQARSQIKDNKVSFLVSNEFAGSDPYPSKIKNLELEYTLNGIRKTISKKEGEFLNLV